MKGKIKSARRKASKLHGAEATFVSLVDAGANETPFTIVKSADGAKAMPITKRKTPAKKSHKPVSTKKKTATPETTTETLIAKMVFSSDHFEDEAAVETYLDAAEWDAESIKIEKNDDGDFVARANDLEDDDFEKIAEVNLDGEEGVEGVQAFVGQRQVEVKTDDAADDEDDDAAEEEIEDVSKSDDDDEDDEDDAEGEEEEVTTEEKGKKKPYEKAKKTPAKKAAPKKKLSKRAQFIAKRKDERAKEVKFDVWDARFSSGNTLAKTLKDGMDWDGTPPVTMT